jgi:hypothetical protein
MGFWFRALAAVILIGGLPASAPSAKSSELNRAVAEIKSARQVNSDRLETAVAKRDELRRQIQLFKEEIAQERRSTGIGSFQSALQAHRIANNLKLIQRIAAYVEQLDRRTAGFEAANLRLEFYLRQAEDELLMLKALNDADSARLAARIWDVLEENALQAAKPLVVVSELRFRNLEAIWNEVAGEPQR